MAKILNKEELQLFLRVLAEESVKEAYASEMAEADDDPLFGGDEEEGEPGEGGDEVEAPDEEGGDEGGLDALAGDAEGGDEGGGEEELPAPEPEQQPQQDKVEARPTPLTLELGEVTSDGLMATLNMIRAGRSF